MGSQLSSHSSFTTLCQVLFFTPAMRDALLQHVPDAGTEFCLTDEMSFLFRMLATAAQGAVCQVGLLLPHQVGAAHDLLCLVPGTLVSACC